MPPSYGKALYLKILLTITGCVNTEKQIIEQQDSQVNLKLDPNDKTFKWVVTDLEEIKYNSYYIGADLFYVYSPEVLKIFNKEGIRLNPNEPVVKIPVNSEAPLDDFASEIAIHDTLYYVIDSKIHSIKAGETSSTILEIEKPVHRVLMGVEDYLVYETINFVERSQVDVCIWLRGECYQPEYYKYSLKDKISESVEISTACSSSIGDFNPNYGFAVLKNNYFCSPNSNNFDEVEFETHVYQFDGNVMNLKQSFTSNQPPFQSFTTEAKKFLDQNKIILNIDSLLITGDQIYDFSESRSILEKDIILNLKETEEFRPEAFFSTPELFFAVGFTYDKVTDVVLDEKVFIHNIKSKITELVNLERKIFFEYQNNGYIVFDSMASKRYLFNVKDRKLLTQPLDTFNHFFISEIDEKLYYYDEQYDQIFILE